MSTVLTPGAGFQNDLPLFRQREALLRRRAGGRFTSPERSDYLLSILRDGRWHTARELKVYGFSDRELRELVENADGQVFSFPGSPGYKLFDSVTEEEFGQCASLKHQAEAMLRRYSRYQRRHHRHK
jgi:hypothetical protein